jgi:hypothetical protein
MNLKKLVIIIIGISLAAIALYNIADSLSPGSYGNAQEYDLDVPTAELIELVAKFKDENPQFKVPANFGLSDHTANQWFVAYFYFPQQNETFHTTIRSSGRDRSAFSLVAVNEDLTGKWKDINKDFESAENKILIDQFEKMILEPIKEKGN